jgi:hypothetical protein
LQFPTQDFRSGRLAPQRQEPQGFALKDGNLMQSASISIEPIGAGFLGDGMDAQPRAENCTACLFGHFF